MELIRHFRKHAKSDRKTILQIRWDDAEGRSIATAEAKEEERQAEKVGTMKRDKSFYLILWCIVGFLSWAAIMVVLNEFFPLKTLR